MHADLGNFQLPLWLLSPASGLNRFTYIGFLGHDERMCVRANAPREFKAVPLSTHDEVRPPKGNKSEDRTGKSTTTYTCILLASAHARGRRNTISFEGDDDDDEANRVTFLHFIIVRWFVRPPSDYMTRRRGFRKACTTAAPIMPRLSRTDCLIFLRFVVRRLGTCD